MSNTTRVYKNTETNDYWEVREIEKPYNVGVNTGLHVGLQLICTADFKNPLDVMSKEEYEEKGYESFTCYVYSEGIDEAAEANEYEVIGNSDWLDKIKDNTELVSSIKAARKGFYKSHYDIDLDD